MSSIQRQKASFFDEALGETNLEDQRRRWECYLDTLSQIALQLLSVTDWRGAMPAIFTDLGIVSIVDRICMFQVVTNEQEPLKLRHLFHWTVKGCELPPDALPPEVPVSFLLTPKMVDDLEQGKPVWGQVRDLPFPLRENYEALGCRSYLMLPILVESRWWGILGFAQCSHKRLWSEMDIAMFRVAVSLIGSAIERQQAMERQLESERQFRDLFENAVIGIYRSTPEGRFLIANETLAHINGYDSVAELMALDIPTQIYADPEDRERFKRLMEEQGFVADYRYPIKRKDGSIGWVAKWARAVKNKAGKVLYYEGFVLDITEQVELMQRLQRLQSISRLLVMRLDLDSILQAAMSEITQLYPEAAVMIFRHVPEQQGYALVTFNEVATDWAQAMGWQVGTLVKARAMHLLEQRLWAGESIITNDFAQGVSSAERHLYELGYQSAFLRGIGVPSYLWGVFLACRKGVPFSDYDVTFLNSFCDSLSIAIRNALLFGQVQQAYDELRSVQEKAMEQERLRALGQMASGIAHDINNALVPIQGFAELLSEHPDARVREAAQVIFKGARDIAVTVQRMREFYRPRADDELLEPVDLNALCRDALEMTRPRWWNIPQERGMVIIPHLELADNLPLLSGLPNEIRQALVNLILNAADAMPDGGTLTLRTYRAERSGRPWSVVEVSDTGVGMDEETRRRAIEPFFTTKGESGSGLGLSAVYGIVQRHEGFMEIDSELGKGTTVRLWFPSSMVEASVSDVGEVPSLRLLVIDDEPSVREAVATLLRRDGHIVTTASDGEQGVEIFRFAWQQGQPFDVVVTDLGMPHIDGLTVARNIKTIAPQTLIILLSGWGFHLQEDEMQEWVNAVVTKPATHQQLRRALSQVWQSRQPTKM